MIAVLLLTGTLAFGGPHPKAPAKAHAIDTTEALWKIERWIDGSLLNSEKVRERQHQNEKGAGKIHQSIFPTYYDSPFNPKWDWA